MAINQDNIRTMLQDMAQKAKAPECPAILQDERLEDVFKTPVYDKDGYSEELPTIWNDYSYGKYDDGTLIITLKSASISSNLYSKYLDEEALVWDSVNERLLLYIPDPEEPSMAFKGSSWQFAKRLKPEYDILSLRDIYEEYFESNK